MPYRVLETSFINNTIVEPGGDPIELPEGVEPGPNLQEVDGDGNPVPKKGKGDAPGKASPPADPAA